jgi:hypothetical protein
MAARVPRALKSSKSQAGMDEFVRKHLSQALAAAADGTRKARAARLRDGREGDDAGDDDGGDDEGDDRAPRESEEGGNEDAPSSSTPPSTTTATTTTATATRLLRARCRGLELELAAARSERDAARRDAQGLARELASARLGSEASAREARAAQREAERLRKRLVVVERGGVGGGETRRRRGAEPSAPLPPDEKQPPPKPKVADNPQANTNTNRLLDDLARAKRALQAAEERAAEAIAKRRQAEEQRQAEVRGWARERAALTKALQSQGKLVEVLKARCAALEEGLEVMTAEEALVRAMVGGGGAGAGAVGGGGGGERGAPSARLAASS